MVDKRVLILGSMAACILIVFASFNSVLGYISIKDPEIVDSPLFRLRTQRYTTPDNSERVVSERIGKDKNMVLFISNRDNKSKLSQVIQMIQHMDEETSNKLIEYIERECKQELERYNLDINEIRTGITELRTNPQLKNLNFNMIDTTPTGNIFCITRTGSPTLCEPMEHCLLKWTITLIYTFFLILASPFIFLYLVLYSIVNYPTVPCP